MSSAGGPFSTSPPPPGPPASVPDGRRSGAGGPWRWLLLGALLLAAFAVGVGVTVAVTGGEGAGDAAPSATAPTTAPTAAPTTAPPATDPSLTIPPSTAVPGPGTAPATTVPGARVVDGVVLEDRTLPQAGVPRQVLVMTPVDLRPGERLPVVVVLHGLGVDRNGVAAAGGWQRAVARDRFIAAFPQGILSSWNAGPCCPPANLVGTDDVAWIGSVVDALSAQSNVDPARRYLTGFSNGGIMTYAVACARPELFAAVAPMAGTNLSGCRPPTPVSLLHSHGDPDPTVPFDGGPTLAQVLSAAPFPPVVGSVAAWAAADGCAPDPVVLDEGDGVVRRRWTGCSAGRRVELVSYPGNGHNWSTAPYDATADALRFFGIG